MKTERERQRDRETERQRGRDGERTEGRISDSTRDKDCPTFLKIFIV